MEPEERNTILEEVLESMTECAQKLRSLHDPRIEAYCLADFEGKEHGWLGFFVRDHLEQALRAARSDDEQEDETG